MGLPTLSVVAAKTLQAAGQWPCVAMGPEPQIDMENAFSLGPNKLPHLFDHAIIKLLIPNRLFAIRLSMVTVDKEQFDI